MSNPRLPKPLGDLLPKVLQELRAEGRPSLEAIQESWRRLVGEEAAHHSWPRKLTRGRFLVEVDNSGWMYTLSLKKPQLLQGLIELLGARHIKDLSFRIGEKEKKDA